MARVNLQLLRNNINVNSMRGPRNVRTDYLRAQLASRIGKGPGKMRLNKLERIRLLGRPTRKNTGLLNKRRVGRSTSVKDWGKTLELARKPLPGREQQRIREFNVRKMERMWRTGRIKARMPKGWKPPSR